MAPAPGTNSRGIIHARSGSPSTVSTHPNQNRLVPAAPILRLAMASDAGQIQAIYAPIVRETAISFELEPPSVDEMQRRIAHTLDRFPWLVCEREGTILGYAYAGEHRARPAYQWSVDVSVYVHDRVRRAGVGKALYACLFPILSWQGFCTAHAGIALPNPGSVGLHEA